MAKLLPAIDISDFDGSQAEMNQYSEQHYARMAKKAFGELGRGMMLVHMRGEERHAEYFTTEALDDDAQGRQLRTLMETYDPSRQAVIFFSASGVVGSVGIVDIETEH